MAMISSRAVARRGACGGRRPAAPGRRPVLACARAGRRAGDRPGRRRRFPTVPAEHTHARALLDNAMHYVAPANGMVDPVSGLSVRGLEPRPGERASSSGRSPS